MLRLVNRYDLFFLLCSFITVFLSFFLFILDQDSPFISVTGIVLSLLFLCKFHGNIPMFMFFGFALLYNIDASKFYFSNVLLTAWPDFQTKPMVNKVLFCHNLFLASLGSIIPSKISGVAFDLRKFTFRSRYLFFFNLIVCLLIIQFGIQGENIFTSGTYGTANKSTLHEYFIVFYFMLIALAPSLNNLYKSLIFGLAFVYSLKTMIYGGRIEVLQIFLLTLYAFWVFPQIIRRRWIYILLILGFYVNSVVGTIRSNPTSFLQGDYITVLLPAKVFSGDPAADFLNSNQGDVLQSSARILGIVKAGILGIEERILGFASFMISPLVPGGLLPEYSNLASYKQELYGSGGGGLVSAYFFVWLSYLGPVLAGLVIGFFITKAYMSDSVYLKIYGISILVTFPRWFAYNPIFLVKFCVYAVLIYFIYLLIYNSYLKRNVVC